MMIIWFASPSSDISDENSLSFVVWLKIHFYSVAFNQVNSVTTYDDKIGLNKGNYGFCSYGFKSLDGHGDISEKEKGD